MMKTIPSDAGDAGDAGLYYCIRNERKKKEMNQLISRNYNIEDPASPASVPIFIGKPDWLKIPDPASVALQHVQKPIPQPEPEPKPLNANEPHKFTDWLEYAYSLNENARACFLETVSDCAKDMATERRKEPWNAGRDIRDEDYIGQAGRKIFKEMQ